MRARLQRHGGTRETAQVRPAVPAGPAVTQRKAAPRPPAAPPGLPQPDLGQWAEKLASNPGIVPQQRAGPKSLPLSPDRGVVQRYRTNRDGSKTSQYGVYITHETGHVDALNGHNVDMSVQDRDLGNGYTRWKPQFDVIGDCVAAMEEIMHGKKLKYGVPDASHYRDVPGKLSFGETDAKNRKRGRDSDRGYEADPRPGQSYLIARQGYKRNEVRPQFHDAAVVAQDGSDNVTLEATAPASGPINANRVRPIYDMYGTNKRRKTQTFKFTYEAEYGTDATVSVLEPRKPLPNNAFAPARSVKVIDF